MYIYVHAYRVVLHYSSISFLTYICFAVGDQLLYQEGVGIPLAYLNWHQKLCKRAQKILVAAPLRVMASRYNPCE
jgi:hypothetical protein